MTIEPHNLALQLLAETGIVGFLLAGGAIVAGAVAAARTIARLDGDERAAACALAIVAGAFVLHALVDIQWDFLAVTAPALFAGGVLLPAGGRVRRVGAPFLVSAAAGVAALAVGYSLLAPWLSARQVDAALDDIAAGRYASAVSHAERANSLDPLSIAPLQVWATAEGARRRKRIAYGLWQKAAERQPENGRAWFDLGSFELAGREQPVCRVPRPEPLVHARSLGARGAEGGPLDQARAIVNRGG